MTKNLKRILSLCLVLALITAMALTMVSCDKKTTATDGTKGSLPEPTDPNGEPVTEAPTTEESEAVSAAPEATEPTEAPAPEATEPTEAPAPEAIGTFTLTVTFADGSEETKDYPFYEEGTLGDFLIDNGIAQGEDGDYGLYIKTVLGESHEYEDDGSYWAFYIDGEYAMTGVSDTELEAGVTYQLKAEK